MYGWRARIGLMTPMCEGVEHAFHLYAPEGVTVCSMKFGVFPDRESQLEEIKKSARICSDYCLDIIIIGSGDGTLLRDEDFDHRAAKAVFEITGIPTVTNADSILLAFQVIGCSRASLLSAYTEDRTEQEKNWLEKNSIRVMNCQRMDLDIFDTHPYRQEAVSNRTIYTQAVESKHADSNIFFLSGMNLSTMEIIPQLETDLEMPVITTQQAMLYAALRHCRINGTIDGLGTLFSR